MKPPITTELATATVLARWGRYINQPPMRIFTKEQIEQCRLKSQALKIEAYKQAQLALKKPFST